MRITFLLLVLLSIDCRADPIKIEKSISPDGKFYLTINPSTDDHMYTSDMLQIRRSEDKKVVATFEWGQFGPHISSSSATTLWKPNSTAFALTWNMAKGWMGSKVYVKSGSKWVDIPFPIFKGIYVGRNGWTGGSKGCLVVIAWKSKDILKTDFTERLDWHGKGSPPPLGDVGEDDWAYFRLTQNANGPTLEFLRVEAKTASEIQNRNNELILRQAQND